MFLGLLAASQSAMAGKLDEPDEKAIAAKALTNTRIKQSRKSSQKPAEKEQAPLYSYTQTEAYLKVMLPSLGESYVENDTDHNIREFMRLTPSRCSFMSSEEASQIVQNERKHSNYFVLYNALRSGHNFAYDLVDLMRQVIQIKAPYPDKRRFARMFDGLFQPSEGDSPINSFINTYVEDALTPDTARTYQLRAASTNMFLFGNTQTGDENTLAYIGAGFVENKDSIRRLFHSGEILESVFLNMGFDQDTVPDRIKRYETLFEKYEYFWRRGTLQQIFLSPEAVSEDTYISGPFGVLEPVKLGGEETKDPLPILKALRDNPTGTAEEIVKESGYLNAASFIDHLQARLLWNPKDIEEGKIILKTTDLFKLTDLKQLDEKGKEQKVLELKKQMKVARQDLEKLVIEDLADWLKLPDLTIPQLKIQGEGVKTPLSLLQLKKFV